MKSQPKDMAIQIGKNFAIRIFVYGLIMAIALSLLKILEAQYLLKDLSIEIYIGFIAAAFTALGIWVGYMFVKNTQAKTASPQNEDTYANQDALAKSGISPREWEVLKLMAHGCSNQEIADKLFISLPTVKTHSSNLFTKLDAKRRTQAIQKAKELKLLA